MKKILRNLWRKLFQGNKIKAKNKTNQLIVSPMTRFSILPDERRVIMGQDNDCVFDAGIVYEVYKMCDIYVVKPVGEYALPKKGGYPNENSEIEEIMLSGNHLITQIEKNLNT